MWSPVRAMNRTVRRRSVAVPWSLFPRELSVGQVLSLLWRGRDWRLQLKCIIRDRNLILNAIRYT